MSRAPLRDSVPNLQQAQAQLNVNRAAFIAARTTRNTDRNAWYSRLSDSTASQAAIVAAQQAYRQSEQAFDNARQAHIQSVDAVGAVQDGIDLRQDYLQRFKDQRDPSKQVTTFPAACGLDLPTVMSYQLDEWNDVCAEVRIGEQYWEFTRPAACPAVDADTRALINRHKLRLRINLRRWIINNEAFAAVCTSLEEAGYGINRLTRT